MNLFKNTGFFFMKEKNKEKNEGCAVRNKKKRKIKIDRNGMQRSPRCNVDRDFIREIIMHENKNEI